MAIRVLLVDDHEVVVREFGALLGGQPGITVVGTASGGQAALELVGERNPDVVIIDVTMADMTGIDATHRILRDFPEVYVLGLSLDTSRRVVGRMLDAGASGYILKTCSPEELVRAVEAVASGKTYLSPEITDGVVRQCARKVPSGGRTLRMDLSDRQREVLRGVAEGKTVREIAATIRVSVKTVEAHRQHIMDKLGVRNVAALTEFAVREGLTPLDS